MVSIRAIYEDGKLRLLDPIDLREGQEVSITIVNKDAKNLSVENERILGLHLGSFEMAEDFDAPLPDSFWLGDDE